MALRCAIFPQDSPTFVLSCIFGEAGCLQEAMENQDLQLLFSPGVGIYLPFSSLTKNFTPFLSVLNTFCHKTSIGRKRFPNISAKLNNLQVCLSEECQGQHAFEDEMQVVAR